MNVYQNMQEIYRQQFWVRPDVETSKRSLEENPGDPKKHYEYALALLNLDKNKEAANVLDLALSQFPFEAFLYFARGRARNRADRYGEAIADYTMALTLQPDFWSFWYYRAVAYSMNGFTEKAVEDFKEVAKLAPMEERAPVVHWMYTSYLLELNDPVSAQASLKLFDPACREPQPDYGYARCVRLYQGVHAPDTFIDLEDMKKNCVQREGRIELELQGMYYGLYAFYTMKGDRDKAKAALDQAREYDIPNAFASRKTKQALEQLSR